MALLALGACEGSVDLGRGALPIDSDGGTGCGHPAEGCACSADQPPIDCYLDAEKSAEGRITCSRGARYCRDGAWTGCESIESYQLRNAPGMAALITGPTTCNVCDPACFVSRDQPDDMDLPGRSTAVTYDGTLGGITLDPLPEAPLPELADRDGDGVPDVADECDGPGAIAAADGSCYGDNFLYVQLPYGGPSETLPLEHEFRIRSADIYFLVDTTGSMDGEIANLRASLTSGTYRGCSGGIIGAVRCTIPDSYFGVGSHDDYPIDPYGRGSGGDVVFEHLLDESASASAAQTAINSLRTHDGRDIPESQGQALWALASGGGLSSYLDPRTNCPPGRSGYPCFRDGVLRVGVLITDAAFHNGPNGNGYSFASASLPPASAVSGNDTRASARRIGNAATSWTGWSGNTCAHDDDYNSPCLTDNNGDVVFEFTVSATAPITISTEGSSFDTALTLYNNAGTALECDDDDGPGSTAYIRRTLTPGTYFVVVNGYNRACGNYRLSVGVPTGAPVSWADTVDALNAQGMHILTVNSGNTAAGIDANDLADATGSYSPSGARHVYTIASNGSGVSDAVVNGILDLAGYRRMDLTTRVVDNPATPTVDERDFLDSVTTRAAVGSCAGTSGGVVFQQCLPGALLSFNATFRNDVVMSTATAQVFDFWIEVIGNGTTVIERVPVRVVVPGVGVQYPASGTYRRDYRSTGACLGTERPDWISLAWDAPSMPAGTAIRWELRTADTPAGLASAPLVSVTTPPTMGPIDIGSVLSANGSTNYRRHLRVTAVLLSSSDRLRTPTLRSFEAQFICVPIE